ncbi:MAG: hypothetical protein J7521_06630 [Caulobacter sp.]|nr:hypothetical protein [Caulobacter sp.]
MAKSKQSPELEIVVDGETYLWRLHRQPGWSQDAPELHGMAIAVRHQEGVREVVIEFPTSGQQPRWGAPLLKVTQVNKTLVANAIASAIAAGWEPHSRGKTVTVVVDAAGN